MDATGITRKPLHNEPPCSSASESNIPKSDDMTPRRCVTNSGGRPAYPSGCRRAYPSGCRNSQRRYCVRSAEFAENRCPVVLEQQERLGSICLEADVAGEEPSHTFGILVSGCLLHGVKPPICKPQSMEQSLSKAPRSELCNNTASGGGAARTDALARVA